MPSTTILHFDFFFIIFSEKLRLDNSYRQTIHIKCQVLFSLKNNIYTLQPLHNTVCYNTVLDITRFEDGSQKCIDYIEK